MNPKCQICNHSGVEMWDTCPECDWENDDALFIDEDQAISVDFDIPKRAWGCYSYANKCTPNAHRTKKLRKSA